MNFTVGAWKTTKHKQAPIHKALILLVKNMNYTVRNGKTQTNNRPSWRTYNLVRLLSLLICLVWRLKRPPLVKRTPRKELLIYLARQKRNRSGMEDTTPTVKILKKQPKKEVVVTSTRTPLQLVLPKILGRKFISPPQVVA